MVLNVFNLGGRAKPANEDPHAGAEAVLKELEEEPLTADERLYLDAKLELRRKRVAEHRAEKAVREARKALDAASNEVGLAEDKVHRLDRKVYRDLDELLEKLK